MSALYRSLSEHREKVIKQGRGVPIQKFNRNGKLIWVRSNHPGDIKHAIDRMQSNLNRMR